MSFQADPNIIRWRLHLKSPPIVVYRMFATSDGRARFWAESAEETDGVIEFRFPGGQTWRGEILENGPPHRFAVRYFGGSVTTVEIEDDGAGGTDLTLTDAGVPAEDRSEVIAGWVSVLMALKAAVDFDVDLRNHDAHRTWAQSFADN